MHINRLTLCLQVPDVAASTAFFVSHFGYQVLLDYPGSFAKLRHDNDHELFLLQCGAQLTPEESVGTEKASGLVIALEVDDARAEEERLRAAGVAISAPLRDEPWGERLFQVKDPNGLTVQLLEWVKPAAT
jgi:catechol 2,3-dioxygenase-like lactoylglutathione lyase family enzyme